jgi:hypothetical protein
VAHDTIAIVLTGILRTAWFDAVSRITGRDGARRGFPLAVADIFALWHIPCRQ